MKKYSFLSNSIFAQTFTGRLALLTIALLLMTFQTSAQISDTTAPEIVDFSFTPSVIDTTSQAQSVVVNVRATDNGAGVNLITVRFRSAAGNQFGNAFINSQQRISGDGKDGVYSAAVTFPQYSKAGTWSVLEIEARDEANNYKTLGTAEIASLGFATELQVISNNEDLNAPEVSDLRFDKSSVDTSSNSQVVTFTVRVIDAFSGVRSIDLHFTEPSTDYLIATDFSSLHLISGDSKDGVYTGTVTFPQGTDTGTWYANVSVSDSIGNQKTIAADELIAKGFASEIQVIGATPQSTEKSRKRARIF